MEFLYYILLFMTGWWVCWIQMSKSESREVTRLKSKIEAQYESETWKSKYPD